jgi:hypothetical protein
MPIMILFLPFALMQAAVAAPLPASPPVEAPASASPTQSPQMTDQHLRDIRCVAYFGVAASYQRQGITGYHPTDVRVDGPRWAGIVGNRVMRDTGLPKEVVGFAIQEAVPEASGILKLNNPYPTIERYEAECVPLMRADLLADDAQNKPLPKPLPRPSGKSSK